MLECVSHISGVIRKVIMLACALSLIVPENGYALTVPGVTVSGKNYTVEAPGGVGDVVALTNLLAQLNALSNNERYGSTVLLKPGVYNLKGVYMDNANHLVFSQNQGGMIAGLGENREDTILLGGGEIGGHRVLSVKGSNYGWMTVSNLTVTGGWSSDGGGIYGNASTKYSHCIISNNFAWGSGTGAGGGGARQGRAEYCLFADNRVGREQDSTKYGGGFWTDGGGGLMGSIVQGAFYCVFSNNWASGRGGALYLAGKCVRCEFIGNLASNGGAIFVDKASYTWGGGSFKDTVEIKDCVFEKNALSARGNGSVVYCSTVGIPVLNSEFIDNGDLHDGEGVIYGCNLYDCKVRNNSRNQSILYNCNLNRCVVSGNYVYSNAAQIDSAYGASYTNVNCVFSDNIMTRYGRVSYNKTFINCTIVGNESQNGGNYGYICAPDCALVNCVLSGNKIGDKMYDVRAIYGPVDQREQYKLNMVNCACSKFQTGVDENWDGLVNCRQIADMKFENVPIGDYTPKVRSGLYDAGLCEEWLLFIVGNTDILGRTRVFAEGIDIGAYECQIKKSGFKFIIR